VSLRRRKTDVESDDWTSSGKQFQIMDTNDCQQLQPRLCAETCINCDVDEHRRRRPGRLAT